MTRLHSIAIRAVSCLRHCGVWALIALWLLTAAGGLYCAVDYELRPGLSLKAPSSWPPASKVKLASSATTLVMFVHPECPCTRASLAELSNIEEHCGAKVYIRLVLVKPAGLDVEWRDSQIWTSVLNVPHAEIVYDPDGKEAARFGATSSGWTLAYNHEGRLLFAGGITGARGHYGPSAGSEALLAAVEQQSTTRSAAIFGCPLTNGTSKACRCSKYAKHSDER